MDLREEASNAVDNLFPHVPLYGPPLPMAVPTKWPDKVIRVLGNTPIMGLSKLMLNGQAKIVNTLAGR
jgi:hypothetical protein